MIPKPPCPRTFPTEYRAPCNLVPTGKAGVDAAAGASGEPHEEHETAEFRFSELHRTQRIELSRYAPVILRMSSLEGTPSRGTVAPVFTVFVRPPRATVFRVPTEIVPL